MPDLSVENHGTIMLLTPASPIGREWTRNHLPADATRFGDAYAIEPRYITDIVIGAIKDGLSVE